MTFETYLWISLAVVTGSFIQGSTGLGFALIVAPVLGVIKPELLPVSLLILMLPLNAHIAWRERKSIDLFGSKWISFGRIFGAFGGLWILMVLPIHYLNILIGLSTILASLATWTMPAFSPSKKAFVSSGIVTGITETATGIGGPPLALVYQHMPVSTLRASVATCFLIGECLSLILLLVNNLIQKSQLIAALYLLPALLMGMLLAQCIHKSINQRFLRTFVLIFAISSGTFLLFH